MREGEQTGGAAMSLPEAVKQLPPLPHVLMRALEMTRDPDTSRADLARVLSLDQALTGRFLRMVNSAYYSLPRRITSLNEAIGFLGYETVEEAIFAISAGETLTRPLPSYMLDRQMLWEHSIAVAEGSEWVAKQRQISPRSDAYVAGLLHDVGKVVLDLVMKRTPAWGEEIGPDRGESPWFEVERRLLGRDHAEVGAVVTRSWNLPDRVVEAVACHHAPAEAVEDPRLAAAVHLADAAALMAGIGVGVDGLRYPLDESTLALLQWGEEDMLTLVDRAQEGVDRAREMVGAVA